MNPSRRQFLLRAAAVAASAATNPGFGEGAPALPAGVQPLPLSAVRLLPSTYATAVETNRRYLLRLSADRLLHNFLLYAGLAPKAEIYGGWENDTIAGHTLGHYLSALVLVYQQTGDSACRSRAEYVVAELARAQKARTGPGAGAYVGALGKKQKDGKIVDGVAVFEEVRRGEIRSGGFDLNGSWSPLYTVHKVFAGLLDVHAAWESREALAVATGLATYFAGVFDALNDEQMQRMLGCEYGGLNESYAELYARTGDQRWLRVAERLYDRRVLDPLERGEDKLANFHANTQVPKLIGLARIHELTNDPAPGHAARFFWTAVTEHHSYVIGGNADREYFSEPDTIAAHITEQTCEHCNTYNMLKLTRHLYAAEPDGRWFDYYERAHLNHVMAQQDPETGGFTYMTPLLSGAERGYSKTEDDAFWCCVGTGMESHAKHGDSIFWQGAGKRPDTLLVNLYIPAQARWAAQQATLRLETRYPLEGTSTLTVEELPHAKTFTVGLRVPGWAGAGAVLKVNGQAIDAPRQRGYLLVRRRWKRGDRVSLELPLEVRTEAAPGDARTIAFLRGPMVLAGDLGAADAKWEGNDPAVVGENLTAAFTPVRAEQGEYAARGIFRPADLRVVPFFSQYRRRSAVYFSHFSEAQWAEEEASFAREQARARDIAARSVDVMHLGEMQPERDHDLKSESSYPVTYRGRQGRDARSGGYFEFVLKTRPGALILEATYWGGERGNSFDILVDNQKVGTEVLRNDKPGKFFAKEYPIPAAMTEGKSTIRVRFLPHDRSTAGPVFGVRLFTAAQPVPGAAAATVGSE